MAHSTDALVRHAVAQVAAVREAVGGDVDLCLDYHGRSFSPAEALPVVKALEPSASCSWRSRRSGTTWTPWWS